MGHVCMGALRLPVGGLQQLLHRSFYGAVADAALALLMDLMFASHLWHAVYNFLDFGASERICVLGEERGVGGGGGYGRGRNSAE